MGRHYRRVARDAIRRRATVALRLRQVANVSRRRANHVARPEDLVDLARLSRRFNDDEVRHDSPTRVPERNRAPPPDDGPESTSPEEDMPPTPAGGEVHPGTTVPAPRRDEAVPRPESTARTLAPTAATGGRTPAARPTWSAASSAATTTARFFSCGRQVQRIGSNLNLACRRLHALDGDNAVVIGGRRSIRALAD